MNTRKTLCQAYICAQVFEILHLKKSLPDRPELGHGEVAAIVDRLKSYSRFNPDNVADIINVMWPETVMWVNHRAETETTKVQAELKENGIEGDSMMQVTVRFPDGSMGMMFGDDGTFDDFEPWGWSESK